MTERRRARRGVPPGAVVGWVLLAGLLSLARVGELIRPADDDADEAPAWHLPVVVTPEPSHVPVRVLAEVPPAPPAAPAATPAPSPRLVPTTAPKAGKAPPRSLRDLPKPFAALRLAAGPLIMPRLALPRALSPSFPALRSLLARARPGQPIHVMLSAYCLRGTTRRGTSVRPGIIAADPRVFPLARHVELYAGGRYLGRFKVEDTGSAIRGTRIDIWTPDCGDAVRFGMRAGVAELVALGQE